MAVYAGAGLGARLVEAWGLDPSSVRSVNIDLQPGNIANVVISFIVNDEDRVVAEFHEYALVEKATEPTKVDLPSYTSEELGVPEGRIPIERDA